MLSTSEDRKHALIEAATAAAGSEAEFVRTFYRPARRSPVPQRGQPFRRAARSLWAFGTGRQPGAARVRVAPRRAESEGSVVQIVLDDMPFPVASDAAARVGSGLEIHLVAHSVVEGHSGAKVSVMHVELDGDIEEERRSAVTAQLDAVLANVRAAVSAASTAAGCYGHGEHG